MEPVLSRRVDHTHESQLFARPEMLAAWVRLAPKVEAVCALPGMGEWWRVSEAVRLREKNQILHLWLAHGHDPREKDVDLSLEILQRPPYGLTIAKGLVVGDFCANTKDQGEFTLALVRVNQVKSVALVVSDYHWCRAYLTVLKVFLRAEAKDALLVPFPVMCPPGDSIPESGLSPWDSVPGETKRVQAYEAKGDVATHDELKDYLSYHQRTNKVVREEMNW